MIAPDWIAVDWGTSACRAWAMSDADEVLDEVRSDKGMARLAHTEFEPALLDLLQNWLGAARMPIMACGMVGSRQGWAEAPYRAVPATPLGEPIRAAAQDPRLDVHIAPGLSQAAPADVMRGEETQIAGFLAQKPRFDGVLCLPGTHTKWVQISAGEVVSFRSFMTGEMFGALSHHSVLRHSLDQSWDETVFLDAVSDTLSKPEQLAARLFTLRAEDLLHGLQAGAARARLSGLLIGAELAATRPYWLGQSIAILGDGTCRATYLPALTAQGLAPDFVDVTSATLAGLIAARANLKAAVS